VKIRLLLCGEVPPGLPEAILGGLPPPYSGGDGQRRPFNSQPCYDRQRAQIDALCALEQVPEPPPGFVHVGLLGADLFLPALTYVFGLAHLGGRRALASWARLREEGEHGDPGPVTLRRLLIEVVHEAGHGLGLVHCAVPDCPMHRSLWPETVDLKQVDYCPTCLASLQATLSASLAPPRTAST
jgi:archaemetzincin